MVTAVIYAPIGILALLFLLAMGALIAIHCAKPPKPRERVVVPWRRGIVVEHPGGERCAIILPGTIDTPKGSEKSSSEAGAPPPDQAAAVELPESAGVPQVPQQCSDSTTEGPLRTRQEVALQPQSAFPKKDKHIAASAEDERVDQPAEVSVALHEKLPSPEFQDPPEHEDVASSPKSDLPEVSKTSESSLEAQA